MNIMAAGGVDYIGTHVYKALAKAGLTPVTYDNLVYGHYLAVKIGVFSGKKHFRPSKRG